MRRAVLVVIASVGILGGLALAAGVGAAGRAPSQEPEPPGETTEGPSSEPSEPATDGDPTEPGTLVDENGGQERAGPSFTLYLPVPKNMTVWAGGPHANNGSTVASLTRSAVDIGAPKVGSGNPEMAVYASAAGTAHVSIISGKRCQVIIDHSSGWQTRYLHLKSIPAIDNKRVKAGQRIGTTASQSETCGVLSCSTCRHVHLALYHSGHEVSIGVPGVKIGGYTVHQSAGSYCGYWTNKKGQTVASGCGMVPKLVNNQGLP